jgi:hypothetical protein
MQTPESNALLFFYHAKMWCKKSHVEETPGNKDVGLFWSLLKYMVDNVIVSDKYAAQSGGRFE